MKNRRQALPPLLVGLTVLVLALLPPRLSRLGDEELAGTVHAEALAEDSNFPVRPPDMAGRVWLLGQWLWSPGEVTIVQQEIQEPESLEEVQAQARQALTELTEAGVLPSGRPDFPEGFAASRFYLRNPADLSSAGFLLVENRDQRERTLSMVLDLETGLALSFRLAGQDVQPELSSEEAGRRFLDRLGLAYEALGNSGNYESFRLSAFGTVFLSHTDRYFMKFEPEPEPDQDLFPLSKEDLRGGVMPE